MKDFTLKTFESLCRGIQKQGYRFITFSNYMLKNNIPKRFVILRHDVDRKPENALNIARLENKSKIRATYYFRIIKESYNELIIKEITELGHEVGYHYEDLSLVKGDYERAIKLFEYNLERLRQLYPVKTICMHGSPLSNWNNRLIWKKYDYRDFDIIGEPNFDINFNEVLYLTDTGRSWNGSNVSVRDKVESKFNYSFRNTFDIINTLNKNSLPDRLMINIHPHRWTDKLSPWLKELIWQKTKNIGKWILVKVRG